MSRTRSCLMRSIASATRGRRSRTWLAAPPKRRPLSRRSVERTAAINSEVTRLVEDNKRPRSASRRGASQHGRHREQERKPEEPRRRNSPDGRQRRNSARSAPHRRAHGRRSADGFAPAGRLLSKRPPARRERPSRAFMQSWASWRSLRATEESHVAHLAQSCVDTLQLTLDDVVAEMQQAQATANESATAIGRARL